jgi:DNA polymerase I-like protein with 3'-5' exonuclease and polymerase domains
MNYIVTNNKEFFNKIGKYNFCELKDMILPETISIDTETTGLDSKTDEIFCIQIGTGSNNYLIDLQIHKENTLLLSQVMPYILEKELIFHNAAFDLGFLFKKNYFPKKVRDTMLASMIYYNGDSFIRHSFKECMERELKIYYDKTEQANIATVKLSQPSTIQYCFNDVDKLIELHNDYLVKLKNTNAIETYDLHCKHIRALTYMELCGLPISPDKWKSKMELDFKKYKENERIVIDYIFDNLPKFRNLQLDLFCSDKKIKCLLSSPSQMIPVFKEFGINVEVDDKGVKKESLEKTVISKSNHPFIKLWLNFKEAEHNVTTFGESIYSKINNGRIYTRFKPILDTARIASRKGEINFLNFPANKETRDCFTANKGFKMICCDFEGQENVVGADLTNDTALIKSITDGLDLHCAFAKLLYPEIKDLSDDVIKKEHKDKRNSAKAPRFAFTYGGTGYTVAMNEGISIEEGMRLENLFKELHSGVYEYGEKKLKESIQTGYIEYAMGFKLKLPKFDNFIYLHSQINKLDKEFWNIYREGKKEYNLKKQSELKEKSYTIKNNIAYELFMDNKRNISEYFSLKSQYFRLCLNAPTQGTAAHQTKYATVLIFDHIEKNNHYWKARISNIIHDEALMEIEDSLVDEYKVVVEESMKKGGNYFLKNPILKMGAESNIGNSWYEAK